MVNIEKIGDVTEINQLISIGKEKGYLTYEEVNNVLPSNLVAPEQIDDLMHLFGQYVLGRHTGPATGRGSRHAVPAYASATAWGPEEYSAHMARTKD